MASKHAAKPRRKASLSPELEKETKAILGLLENEDDEHWLIGMHFNKIVDGQLYEADGFKTAHEYAAKLLGQISQATLTRYGAIAKAFSEDVAKKYGSSRLEVLLAYERLTDAILPNGDPGQVMIKVPAEGVTSTKPFADCTVEEMRAAVRKQHGPPKPLPAEFGPTIKALQDKLERFGGDGIILMHARPTAAGAAVNFNLPINYLEPLRDILISVFGLPEKASWRDRGKLPTKAAIKKGRAWVEREHRSRVAKGSPRPAVPTPAGGSGKMKQMSRNGRRRMP